MLAALTPSGRGSLYSASACRQALSSSGGEGETVACKDPRQLADGGAPESRRVFGVLPKTDLSRSAPTLREADVCHSTAVALACT